MSRFLLEGKHVAVLGASSGIGESIAREAAARGASVTLVARRRERLSELAERIRGDGGEAEVIAMDLAETDAADRLISAIGGERLPDILVINAGRGRNGRLTDFDDDTVDAIGAVNATAPLLIAHAFAGAMKRRGSGAILFTASVAAFAPAPFHAFYAATKTFLLSFAEALRMELSGSGVHVATLCPGVTETEFFRAGGYIEKSPVYRRKKDDPDRVAKAAIDGVLRGRAIITPGFFNRLYAFLGDTLPLPLMAWITGRVMTTD